MEKLIILFLTLLAIPLYASGKAADKLDLTLPETPFENEQMDRDSKIIKDWEERNRLRLIDNLPRPNQEQRNYSWKINALDMITTIYALDTHNNVKEANIILGEQPELIEVFALKMLVLPIIHQNSNEHQMVWFNAVVTAATINNLYVINRYD